MTTKLNVTRHLYKLGQPCALFYVSSSPFFKVRKTLAAGKETADDRVLII